MDNNELLKELEEFGFDKAQIELAIKFTQNKEEIIEMYLKICVFNFLYINNLKNL